MDRATPGTFFALSFAHTSFDGLFNLFFGESTKFRTVRQGNNEVLQKTRFSPLALAVTISNGSIKSTVAQQHGRVNSGHVWQRCNKTFGHSK